MSIDISGGDRIEVVGESFYRSALRRIGAAVEGDDRRLVASLVPEPANPYDRNAVMVMIDGEQVGHLPRDLAAILAPEIAQLVGCHGEVNARAEIRGSSASELGFGVVLGLDLAMLNAAIVDDVEVQDISSYAAIVGGSSDSSATDRPAEVPSSTITADSEREKVTKRRPTIERAVERWKTDLIDLTARNRLLYMRELKAGTLNFDISARDALMQLVAGKRVALSKIVPRSRLPESPAAKLTPFEDAVRRVRTIVRTARTYEEERGVRTLFLACGVATWRSDRASRPPAAPVLLVPIAVRARGASQQDFEFSLAGDLEVNPTLLHMLKVEFNLEIDDRELYEHSDMDGVIDTPEELRLAFNWLSEKCARIADWAVVDRFVLGNFWYAKLPMVKDLENSIESLALHDVAAAFAGDAEARNAVAGRRGGSETVSAADVDGLSPESEFNVLDSDSSQSLAIARARRGEDLVLRGPPGTGKSQTIANLICNAIGERKRVLFVAEKRAAIEAVTKRLNGAGIGDLVLDLHQGAESRKWLASQLGDSLAAIRSTENFARGAEQARLSRARDALRTHTESLHFKHAPWDMSVFNAQMEVLRLGRPGVAARLRGPDLEQITDNKLGELDEALRDLLSLGGLSLRAEDSPWSEAALKSGDEVRGAEEILGQLVPLLEGIETDLSLLAEANGFEKPLDLNQAADLLGVLGEIQSCAEVFDTAILHSDIDQLMTSLQALRGSAISRLLATVGSSEYRAARDIVRGHLHPNATLDPHDLYARLVTCQELQSRLRVLRSSESPPPVPGDLTTLEKNLVEFRKLLSRLGGIVGREMEQLAFSQIGSELLRLEGDLETARVLPTIGSAREKFDSAGLAGFLVELERDQASLPDARVELERLWWQSLADHLAMQPAADGLAAFRGGLHDQVAEEFRDLDCRHIEAAAQHVRRVAAEGAVAAQDQFPDQGQLVRAQAKRKRGHMPVRELFAQAPDVVTALRPCWVMSPLMVSQLIPSDRAYFDVVVFDEASQVRPVDALTSMIRGGQLVVAGDERQLPPTTFFDASAASDGDEADADEDSTEIADYESLLDVLMTLFETEMLRWHYRSRDERLIGFSNMEIYDGGLTTFPGVVDGEVLEHVWVDAEPREDEARVSPDAEVRRVVELVIEHAQVRPTESLGVIALGSQHADAIEAGLLSEMPNHPDLEAFFSEGQEERFFVKNLERVQGDERDAIILAVGYGKLPDGTLPHRFGPLNSAGGERRLNVAVTRAKRRMTVVSSFQAEDIDVRRSGAEGVRLLRSFLAYAASGGELSEAVSEELHGTALHRQIAAALDAAGYECVELLGSSADRIDVAVIDPSSKLPTLAVEIDGDAYARRPSVRDRDRLRSEHLERLGWGYVSTWSQDWYRDPSSAARDLQARVVERFEQTKLGNEETDAGEGFGEDDGGTASVENPGRGPRPALPAGGRSITDWRQRDLIRLAEWIESDGILRTTDELKDALMREIGITRRGSRVVRVLDEVVSILRPSPA